MPYRREIDNLKEGEAATLLPAKKAELDEERELEERAVNEHSALVASCARQALSEGKVEDQLLDKLEGRQKLAIEALIIARLGADNARGRRDANYVSAYERKRILNDALVELQPIIVTPRIEQSDELGAQLKELGELVIETRHKIGQAMLLETAKGGIGDLEQELEDGQDEEDPEAGSDEAEDEEDKKSSGSGFLSLLAGARRRLEGTTDKKSGKKKSGKKKSGKKKSSRKAKGGNEDDPSGGTL